MMQDELRRAAGWEIESRPATGCNLWRRGEWVACEAMVDWLMGGNWR